MLFGLLDSCWPRRLSPLLPLRAHNPYMTSVAEESEIQLFLQIFFHETRLRSVDRAIFFVSQPWRARSLM